jgi:hypothetical protein
MLGKIIGLGIKLVGLAFAGAVTVDMIRTTKKVVEKGDEYIAEYKKLREEANNESTEETRVTACKALASYAHVGMCVAFVYAWVKICYWIVVSIIFKSLFGVRTFG